MTSISKILNNTPINNKMEKSSKENKTDRHLHTPVNLCRKASTDFSKFT